MTARQRYVYFAQAGHGGPIKIGCSVKPEARLLAVSEWVPWPIKLVATMPGSFALETALHNMFADCWSHGEWFHPTPRLTKMVADVAAGKPVSIEPNPAAYDLERRAAIRLKKNATRAVQKAETHAYGNRYWPTVVKRRPRHVFEAMQSYAGTAAPPPTPEVLAILQAYAAELWALPAKGEAA